MFESKNQKYNPCSSNLYPYAVEVLTSNSLYYRLFTGKRDAQKAYDREKPQHGTVKLIKGAFEVTGTLQVNRIWQGQEKLIDSKTL